MVRFLFCVLFLNSYLLGMDGDRRPREESEESQDVSDEDQPTRQRRRVIAPEGLRFLVQHNTQAPEDRERRLVVVPFSFPFDSDSDGWVHTPIDEEGNVYESLIVSPVDMTLANSGENPLEIDDSSSNPDRSSPYDPDSSSPCGR